MAARDSRGRFVKTGIEIGVETKGASKNVKGLASTFASSFKAIGGAVIAVNQGIDLFKRIIGSAVGIVSDLVSAANEQERSLLGLKSALQLQGEEVDSNIAKLDRFNFGIQQSLGFGDEFIQNIQAQFLALGVSADKLEMATRGAIGWSKAVGKDMKSAALDVAKALNGNVLMLRRYGLEVNNAEEASQALEKMFGLAQAQAGTFATKTAILAANFGDLQEELGKAITESENGKAALTTLSDNVLDLIEIFKSPEGIAAINDFFGLVVTGAEFAQFSVLALLGQLDNIEKLRERRAAPNQLDAIARASVKLRAELKDLRDQAAATTDPLLRLAIDQDIIRVNQKLKDQRGELADIAAKIAATEGGKGVLQELAVLEKALDERIKLIEANATRQKVIKRELTEDEKKELAKRQEAHEKLREKISESMAKQAQAFDAATAKQAQAEEEALLNRLVVAQELQDAIREIEAQAALEKSIAEKEAREAALEEAELAKDREREQSRSLLEGIKQDARAITDTIVGGLFDAAKGARNFGEVMIGVLESIARKLASSLLFTLFAFALNPAAGFGAIFTKALGFNDGGLVEPIRANHGLLVPGSGNTDTVPALLTPGELVIDKKTTQGLLNGEGAGPTQVTVIAPFQMLTAPPSRTDIQTHFDRSVMPAVRDSQDRRATFDQRRVGAV